MGPENIYIKVLADVAIKRAQQKKVAIQYQYPPVRERCRKVGPEEPEGIFRPLTDPPTEYF